MDEKIKFSIMAPVYNVENFLDKCIRSVLEQGYRNYELILVDDGSTDGSGRICDERRGTTASSSTPTTGWKRTRSRFWRRTFREPAATA